MNRVDPSQPNRYRQWELPRIIMPRDYTIRCKGGNASRDCKCLIVQVSITDPGFGPMQAEALAFTERHSNSLNGCTAEIESIIDPLDWDLMQF